MQYFEIAFSGTLAAGAERGQVQAAIARLFKAEPETIATLFSGQRVVIKQRLDAATTAKYRAAFKQAGAVLEVTALEAAEDEQTQGVAEAAATESSGLLQVTPRDVYMAAFKDVQAPDFGLAPAGENLLPEPPVVPAPDFDLSALSLAPLGSDLEQLPPAKAVIPDTSHLKLLDE